MPSSLLPSDQTVPPISLETLRKTFSAPCLFMGAAADPEVMPPLGSAEFAFVGRSNVGKSSLINALVHQKALARVSHTPGRTQQLNFFVLQRKDKSEHFRFVDMPGYGYAAVSKAHIESWRRLIETYLKTRPTLQRVFVLIDARQGLKASDEEMMSLLDRCAVSYQLILTKIDKLKESEQEHAYQKLVKAISHRPAAFPEVITTSAHHGEGLEKLRTALIQNLISFERET